MGPAGLLIESCVWHGLKIDKMLTIWQQDEEPVSMLKTPYQSLKTLTVEMATRARTEAELTRKKSRRQWCAEYDREASQIDEKDLDEEEMGIVRTFQMGSNLTTTKIASINEDKSGKCTYCGEMDTDIYHQPFRCSYFNEDRKADNERD